MVEHDFNKYPELTNKQIESYAFDSPHVQITEDFSATVVKVHDGDTISLANPTRDFTFPLRLLDIDAPEMNAGGDVARDWLRNQILNQEVDIKIDPNNRVGKYGRLLGRVVYGGLDVGLQELHLGLAKPFSQRTEGELEPLDKIFSLRQWF